MEKVLPAKRSTEKKNPPKVDSWKATPLALSQGTIVIVEGKESQAVSDKDFSLENQRMVLVPWSPKKTNQRTMHGITSQKAKLPQLRKRSLDSPIQETDHERFLGRQSLAPTKKSMI